MLGPVWLLCSSGARDQERKARRIRAEPFAPDPVKATRKANGDPV